MSHIDDIYPRWARSLLHEHVTFDNLRPRIDPAVSDYDLSEVILQVRKSVRRVAYYRMPWWKKWIITWRGY